MEIYELHGHGYLYGEYNRWSVGTYAYKDVAESDKVKIESGLVRDYDAPLDVMYIQYRVVPLSIYTESQFNESGMIGD